MVDLFRYNSYEVNIDNDSYATKRISSEQTRAAGISTLYPAALLGFCVFEPRGYSMNAILDELYYIIHIVPESDSSYASFETNQNLAPYTGVNINEERTFRWTCRD